jgi:hypothetical protein
MDSSLITFLSGLKIDDVRLHLGDCLDVMGSLEAGSVDLVLTDLPYGTTYCRWDHVIPFEPLWSHYRRLLKPRGAVILTATQPFASMLVMSNPKWFRHEWAWIRGKKASGHLDAKHRPLRRHESILVFAEGRTTYNPIMSDGPLRKATSGDQATASSDLYRPASRRPWNSDKRYPTDVIEIDSIDSRRRTHPTQKPVALMEYLVRTYSDEGDMILDSCMGSGTTGVACVHTGRRFTGIEKDAGYFATAESRIAAAQSERASLLPFASHA